MASLDWDKSNRESRRQDRGHEAANGPPRAPRKPRTPSAHARVKTEFRRLSADQKVAQGTATLAQLEVLLAGAKQRGRFAPAGSAGAMLVGRISDVLNYVTGELHRLTPRSRAERRRMLAEPGLRKSGVGSATKAPNTGPASKRDARRKSAALPSLRYQPKLRAPAHTTVEIVFKRKP